MSGKTNASDEYRRDQPSKGLAEHLRSFDLSGKQVDFLVHYLANGRNATKAAIAAGYSPKTARQSASRLLTYANIKRALASIGHRHGVTAEALRPSPGKEVKPTRPAVDHVGSHRRSDGIPDRRTLDGVLWDAILGP